MIKAFFLSSEPEDTTCGYAPYKSTVSSLRLISRSDQMELSSEIENLKLLDVVQNIFEYDGKKGHQICFVYTGNLTNKSVFEKEIIHVVEPAYEAEAVWVPVKEILESKIPVYPQVDLKPLAS